MSFLQGKSLKAYLETARANRLNRKVVDEKVVDAITDYAFKKNSQTRRYFALQNIVNYLRVFMESISMSALHKTVISYLDERWNLVDASEVDFDLILDQMRYGVCQYLSCPEENIANIFISCVFSECTLEQDLDMKLTLPKLGYPPKGSVFDGTRLVLRLNDEVVYESNPVIAVVKFCRPMTWTMLMSDDFKYDVLVVTQSGETIKTYSVREKSVVEGLKISKNVEKLYGQIYHKLVLDFEYY